MHNLPHDILLEILLQLPVRSLLRFKVVCKSWKSHISDPKFVKRHAAIVTKNPDNSFFIAHDPDTFQVSVINVNFPYKVISLKIPVQASEYYDDLHVVGSCNGLLCIAHRCNGQKHPSKLYLWNPPTGKVKNIYRYSIKFNQKSDAFGVSLGFGFDHASGDYKVVRIVTDEISFKHRVEVYSLNKNSCKEVYVELQFISIDDGCPVTTVNGSVYWRVRRKCGGFKYDLITFNLQSENFSTIILPDTKPAFFNIFECKESVVIAETFRTTSINIWALDDHGCLIKKFTVSTGPFKSIVGCLKTGELVAVNLSDELFLYDTVNKVVKSTQHKICKTSYNFGTYNYSESLVNLI